MQKFNGPDIVPITESEWQKVLDGLLNVFMLEFHEIKKQLSCECEQRLFSKSELVQIDSHLSK